MEINNMEPTAVLILVFHDGTVGRMQYFGKDTSDEALQAEVARSSFPPEKGAVTWVRGTLDDFPAMAAYRNAWTYDEGEVKEDFAKCKDIQKAWMCAKAQDRAERDALGGLKQQSLAAITAEIEALEADIEAAQNLTELYNIWPASIERRTGPREYAVRGQKG